MGFDNNGTVMAGTPAWTGLSVFRIYSASGGNQLYRNGFQQLKIRVVVVAVDRSFSPVALTQSELESVVLVDASSGMPLHKKVRHGPEGSDAWEYTDYSDDRFRELPPNNSFEGSVPSGPFVYVRDFYVNTTSNMPIVVRPRITRADGEMFWLNDSRALASIQLRSLPIAVYRSEQYSISRTAPYFNPTRDIEKVEVFGLELIIEQQRIEFVTTFSMDFHPRLGSSDNRYTGYYLVGYGNGRYMRTTGPVSWERPDALGRSRSENGRVALVLAYGRHGGDVWVRGSIMNASMEARDMYGNLHQLRVELSEDPLLVRVSMN
jgi:hypothetical protein